MPSPPAPIRCDLQRQCAPRVNRGEGHSHRVRGNRDVLAENRQRFMRGVTLAVGDALGQYPDRLLAGQSLDARETAYPYGERMFPSVMIRLDCTDDVRVIAGDSLKPATRQHLRQLPDDIRVPLIGPVNGPLNCIYKKRTSTSRSLDPEMARERKMWACGTWRIARRVIYSYYDQVLRRRNHDR